jgi:hypothetical protein
VIEIARVRGHNVELFIRGLAKSEYEEWWDVKDACYDIMDDLADHLGMEASKQYLDALDKYGNGIWEHYQPYQQP